MGDGHLAAELMRVSVRVAPQQVLRAAVRRSIAGEWGRRVRDGMDVRVRVRVRVRRRRRRRRRRLVGQRTGLRGHLVEHLLRLGARRRARRTATVLRLGLGLAERVVALDVARQRLLRRALGRIDA